MERMKLVFLYVGHELIYSNIVFKHAKIDPFAVANPS